MDNYTDRLLPLSGKHTIRPPMIRNERFLPPPIAEHGFSALIEVSCNDENGRRNKGRVSEESSTFLFDCGISENGVIYNADTLGTDLSSISAIILSHGHLRSLRCASKCPQKNRRIHKTSLPSGCILEKVDCIS